VTELQPFEKNEVAETGEPDGIAQLRYALMLMSERADALAAAGDWEALITGLAPIQAVLGDLRQLEREVKNHIVETMPERQVSVEGVGTVERVKKITRRNWESADLLRFIVQGALVDSETGEIPSSPVEAVERVLVEIYACAPFTGSTAWRVGALKERGIVVDEWCEENLEDYTLKFIRNDNVK